MRIYIGYDSKQSDASRVCEHSIRKHFHVSEQYDIVHLKKDELKNQGIYFPQNRNPGSTEFSYTRFLVPHLENYTGWAMFVDSDFLFTENLDSLFREVLDVGRDTKSVYVCKHPEYVPREDKKFYGIKQEPLPMKNWSSLMIFNCEHPDTKKLTPISVSNKDPAWLHRFGWTDSKNIGSIDLKWNWLVGEHTPGDQLPSGIHFTNGGPFNEVYGQDYEHIWYSYFKDLDNQ